MSATRMSVADIESNIDKMFGTTSGDDGVEDARKAIEGQSSADSEGADGEAAPAQQQDEGKRRDTAKADSVANDGDKQQQPQPARRGQPQDLIGPDGNVIARAGSERRFYEQAQRAQRELAPLRDEVHKLRGEVEAYRTATAMPQQLGLNIQEQTTAMQFMAHWKQDPLGAAKKMIAELRAGGYNIDELGSGTDVFAIKKIVEDAVTPFRQDREQQTQQERIAADVRREIEDVYSEFTWAPANEDALTKLLDVYPNEPLRMIALRLEAYAAKNGYDLTQPLAEQITARQQQQQTRPQPLPSNARGPSGSGAANITPKRGPAAVGRSNRDIVRETMAEFGIELPS